MRVDNPILTLRAELFLVSMIHILYIYYTYTKGLAVFSGLSLLSYLLYTQRDRNMCHQKNHDIFLNARLKINSNLI